MIYSQIVNHTPLHGLLGSSTMCVLFFLLPSRFPSNQCSSHVMLWHQLNVIAYLACSRSSSLSPPVPLVPLLFPLLVHCLSSSCLPCLKTCHQCHMDHPLSLASATSACHLNNYQPMMPITHTELDLASWPLLGPVLC